MSQLKKLALGLVSEIMCLKLGNHDLAKGIKMLGKSYLQ